MPTDIPAWWRWARLADIADLLSGGTPSKARREWWEGSIPWVSPKDMKHLRLKDTQDHISPEAVEAGSRLVPARTILVVVRGMILAKELPVAITEVPMAFNQDIKAILARDTAHPDYLLYAIASRKGALARDIGTSAHGTRRLGTSSLEELLLPLPPKNEQRAIAAFLSALQAATEVQRRIVARLRELKVATMTKLFREGLHGEPLKRTEVGYVPESWAVMRFGDFATLQRGFDLPAHERSRGTVPVIGSNGIVGWHREVKAKGPGVITGRSGSIGLSFYSSVDFWPLNTALFVSDFHGNHPAFVHCLLERFDLGQFSAGVSVPTLNRNLVHRAAVAVPSLLEQIEISRVDVALDNALELAAKKRQALAALFGSILHLLMTGQLRVPPDVSGRLGAEPREAQGTSEQGGRPDPSGQHGKPDEAVLQEIVRRIVEAVAPEKIILFGSAARGEMGPDSDLDLLVIKGCESRREVAVTIYRSLRGIGVPKDVVVATPEDVERDRDTIGYILRPALREGRVLYAV